MTMRGKPRNASAICTVGVGRSQSRGSSLTLRRKCRSSPELKQIPAPLVITALMSRSARTMSSASNQAATSASLRQLRLSGRLRTTRATPASASCSRISSGQALSVRQVSVKVSVIALLLLALFAVVSTRNKQRIEREAAARQHDKGIDVDRLHDVGQILGDEAERDQCVDQRIGIEHRR